MADFIKHVPNIAVSQPAERVLAVAAAHRQRRDRDDEGGFLYEDRVDIDPSAHIEAMPEEIDLSLMLIRALVNGELPPEAVSALAQFAPLGDLSSGAEWCDAIEQRGLEFITWSASKTLAQVLEFMAS